MDITIEKFKDKNGNLSKVWKSIYKKHSDFVDSLGDYDPKTNIILSIRGLDKLPTCKMCGAEISVEKIDNSYCSKKCSANDQDVKDKKLASIDIVSRSKKISSALRGSTNEKSWKTRKELYSNGFSPKGIKKLQENIVKNAEKGRETLMAKYGVDNPFKIESVKKSIRESQNTNNTSRNHLPDWLYDKEKFTNIYNEHGIEGIVSKGGCGYNLAYVLSRQYDIRDTNSSSGEQSLRMFIKSLGFSCEKTREIIKPLELDIYIPEKKLAIEYDGLYWHSSGSRDRDEIMEYHVNKTSMCEAKNVHLLHIFENEWLDETKREIWKSVIRHKLGLSEKIPARKCVIKTPPKKDVKLFLEENHLQGFVGYSEASGLYYKDNLVQVVTFGKGRYQDTTELIRMCTAKGFVVQGGSSKLLKGREFISYANRRWSFGNVYDICGMVKIRFTPPCPYWLYRGKLYHRSSFMKHKLGSIFNNYDPQKSAVENCYANGLRRIWDCGNILYKTPGIE